MKQTEAQKAAKMVAEAAKTYTAADKNIYNTWDPEKGFEPGKRAAAGAAWDLYYAAIRMAQQALVEIWSNGGLTDERETQIWNRLSEAANID